MESIELVNKLAALGLSQRELGRRLNKDPVTVNRWARGRWPVPRYVEAYLNAIANDTAFGAPREEGRGPALRYEIRMTDGNSRLHAKLYEPGAKLATEGLGMAYQVLTSNAGHAPSEFDASVLEGAVTAYHAVNVRDAAHNAWWFEHRGWHLPSVATPSDKIVDISSPIVRRHTLDTYAQAKSLAEPSYAIVERDIGEKLKYARLVVPAQNARGAVERLHIAIAYLTPGLHGPHSQKRAA